MAEYDDNQDYDYGGDENYSDPSEYQDFQWDKYDDQNIDELINEYNDKINDLNDEYKKKKKDSTRAEVQAEIDKYSNRKKFLENLQAYSKRWNPKPNQITAIKTHIGILEKELRDTTSSLNRCKKAESIKERQDKINMISKTLNLYKKSFSLIKNKRVARKPPASPFKSGFMRPRERLKRLPTKPRPTEERIPLPKENEPGESWDLTKKAGRGLGWALGKGMGLGWWASKGVAGGTKNILVEGGSSLYSTFRSNPESEEKVSGQHKQIDRETEQRNEEVVERMKNVVPPSAEEFFTPTEELKTQVTNLAIEKNNLEGEKRKEEVTRQENENLCQEEEKKRENENEQRVIEEAKRRLEEIQRNKENKKLLENLKKLGKGISENESIRIEEEDIRQEQENTRQLNENERQMKEDTRQTFENLRQNDEKIRQELDNNRKIYWEVMLGEKEKWLEKMGHNNEVFQKLMDVLVVDDNRRKNLENTLNVNEDKRLGNETIRLENEQDRRTAEEERMKNENQRIENEKARVNAELKRVTGETKREENEQNRIDEEEKRFVNEGERIANEKARIGREKIALASEKQRIDNEKRRENFYTSKLAPIPEAEKSRVEAEKGRKEREKLFQENEKQRIINENERVAQENRRVFIQEQNLKLLEDRKNKIDQIEMQFSKKNRIEEKQPKKTFETYFTNKENSTEWIEDEKLRKRVENILDNIDKEEEDKPQTYSNALLDGIERMENVNLTKEWEKKIQIEEKEKFKWRQRINILNEAFLDKNIVFTDNDPNIIEFLRKNLKDSETIKTKELNGFFYEDKKIVKRNVKRQFVPIEGENLNNFLTEVRKLNTTAETVISNEVGLFADSETNKEFAESYIRELREEQKQLVRIGIEENGEFFEMEEFNEINREIEDIRKNKKFKIRPKVWARSFGGFVSRMVKYLKIVFKRHFKLLIGLFLTGIGATSTSLILENFLRKAGYKIGEMEKNLPKKIKEVFTKTLPEFFKKYLGNYYGAFLGTFLAWFFYITRGIIFGFTKSVVYLSADIIGMMGKMTNVMITSFGIVGFWIGSRALDSIGYYSYKFLEESFYMRNENPPNNILERRAEDENMGVEKYKQKYQNKSRNYNSTFAKIVSYPISAATYGTGVASDKGKDVLDWMANWGIIVGVLVGMLIFVWLLIKWKR